MQQAGVGCDNQHRHWRFCTVIKRSVDTQENTVRRSSSAWPAGLARAPLADHSRLTAVLHFLFLKLSVEIGEQAPRCSPDLIGIQMGTAPSMAAKEPFGVGISATQEKRQRCTTCDRIVDLAIHTDHDAPGVPG